MDALIATGQARRGLIVTGEQSFINTINTYKVLLKSHDRDVFMNLAAGLTLGDAGAALIMGPKVDPETGFQGIMVESKGEHYRLCVCDDLKTALETDMTTIVVETTKLVRDMFVRFTGKLGWTSEDISLYLPIRLGARP